MSTDRSILRGIYGSVALTAVSIAVSLVQFRLLMNWLPQQVVGLWFLFLSIGGYLILFDLGVSPTLGREISFCFGDETLSSGERAEKVGSLIRSCRAVFVVAAALLFILGTLGGWAYLGTVSPLPLLNQVRLAWVIFVAGTGLSMVGEVWLASLYGMGQVATEKLVRSIGPVLGLVLIVAALQLGYGLPGLAVAWLVQIVATRLVARCALKRLNASILSAGKFNLDLIRRIAVPSLKYAATLLGGILILQTDNVVIASTMGTTEIPGYQAVAKLVTVMMGLSMMLIVTSTPFLSRAYIQQNVVEIKRLLNRNLRFSLSIMSVLGCFLACFADRIISLWLGAQHFIGFGVVWVLIAVMLLEAHHTSMGTATMATGRMPFVVPALLAGLLNIIASVYLARRHGLLGVALGTLCAQVITNNWYVPFYVMRQFKISFAEHFVTVLLPVGKLFIALLATGLAARSVLSRMSDFPALTLGVTFVGGAGVVVFALVVLSSEEREQLVSKLRQSKLGKLVME